VGGVPARGKRPNRAEDSATGAVTVTGAAAVTVTVRVTFTGGWRTTTGAAQHATPQGG